MFERVGEMNDNTPAMFVQVFIVLLLFVWGVCVTGVSLLLTVFFEYSMLQSIGLSVLTGLFLSLVLGGMMYLWMYTRHSASERNIET